MDERRFYEVLAEAEKASPAEADNGAGGIGTLSEKTLHAVLKRCYAPDPSCCEVGIGRFVADVFDGERITEIQTRSFGRLAEKLAYFLPLYPVTVVYPLAHLRNLIWIDPQTGEASAPHRGRKTETPLSALHELWQILQYLGHPGLTVELVLLDLDEYRFLDGWSKNRKSGSTRAERVPRRVADVIVLRKPEDYAALLPPEPVLPEIFTAKDLRKAGGLCSRGAYSAVHVLEYLGVIGETDPVGRAHAYRRSNGENPAYSAAIPSATSPVKRS